jgi:hypothetical protein
MLEETKGVYRIFYQNGKLYAIECERSSFVKKLGQYNLVLLWTLSYIELTTMKAIAEAFRDRADVLIVIPQILANAMLQIPKSLGLSLPNLEVCSESELAA